MGKPKRKNLPDLTYLAQAGEEIEVHVTARAAQNSVLVRGGQLRISVTVVPENGKANNAVQRLLSTAMGVAPSQLRLTRGQTAREKLFVYLGSSRS